MRDGGPGGGRHPPALPAGRARRRGGNAVGLDPRDRHVNQPQDQLRGASRGAANCLQRDDAPDPVIRGRPTWPDGGGRRARQMLHPANVPTRPVTKPPSPSSKPPPTSEGGSRAAGDHLPGPLAGSPAAGAHGGQGYSNWAARPTIDGDRGPPGVPELVEVLPHTHRDHRLERERHTRLQHR
jgi:hypothetical protein